jgi:sugar phosphate isomerase/epimerase
MRLSPPEESNAMFKNLNFDHIGITGRASEVIELTLSFNFKGLDLDMQDYAAQVESQGLPHARRLIDSARLKIGSFYAPLFDEESEERGDTFESRLALLPKWAELASGLGCSRCLAVIRPACDERPYHENFELHRKRIHDAARILEPRGIRLGLEFEASSDLRQGRAFQFIHSLDAVVQLVKSSAAKNAGVVVDPWQMHVAGSSLDELSVLEADQIVALYLSDIPAGANLEQVDESARLLPGEEEGGIDSVAALSRLAEMGYDGPVTPRADRERYQELGREALVRLAASRLDELWQAAGLDASGQAAATA